MFLGTSFHSHIQNENDYSIGFNRALQVTRGYLFLVNVVIPGEAAEFDNLSFNLKALTLKDLKEVSERTEKNIKDNQKVKQKLQFKGLKSHLSIKGLA